MKAIRQQLSSFLYPCCGLALSLLAIVPVGCGSMSGHRSGTQRDMVKAGEIKLDTITSKRVKVLRASVFQEDDTLYISGVVRQIRYSAHSCCIDLEIDLLDSNGTELEHTVVHKIRVSRRLVGRRFSLVRFHAELPATVPMGTMLRIRCTSSSTHHS